MNRHNDVSTDDELQYKFTAYLSAALNNRRVSYISQLKKITEFNELLNGLYTNNTYDVEAEAEKELPILLQMKNEALYDALMKLTERERYVFLSFVLEEKNYEQMAEELGIGYKGVAALYYRTLRKLRDGFRRTENEF